MTRFFTMSDKTLHTTSNEGLIPLRVRQESNRIQEGDNHFAKMRRSMAVTVQSPASSSFFSIESSRVCSGPFDLNHSSNADLIPIENNIVYR